MPNSCKAATCSASGCSSFFYTSISSFVYFELKNLLADYDRETRSQIWASMDLAVNSLTILVAAFATGRIAKYMGLSFTLASVPVLIGAGMLVLAAAPMVGVVVAVQIIRRAGNYAISRPAREMLFTAVDRETRFKAKPVIDIVIYRGGDMLNAWAFTALTQGLGWGWPQWRWWARYCGAVGTDRDLSGPAVQAMNPAEATPARRATS